MCLRLHATMPARQLILILLGLVGLPTIFTLISLLHSHPTGQVAEESSPGPSRTGVGAFFSFHTPSTLFPPSAIISLTDDNSTFFLARPADFGPLLSSKGLSGRLWIGSGFGDDNLGRGGPGAGAEGELGCSDVPGWDDSNQLRRRDLGVDQPATAQIRDKGDKNSDHAGRLNSGAARADQLAVSGDTKLVPSEGDGTDDHLHHPLPGSQVSKQSEPGQSAEHEKAEKGHKSTHADIQSLQESAEISGKIVLLSRGGCGFLEKIKWAQRRGATAVIVGDHTRGGALVTMYGRGDTSNVTIPSLFTSHTTAHLLSSLIPPDSYIGDNASLEEADLSLVTAKEQSRRKDVEKKKVNNDKPTFTSVAPPRATSTSPRSSRGKNRKTKSLQAASKRKEEPSWGESLGNFFGISRNSDDVDMMADSRRPPSSGRIQWSAERLPDELSREKDFSYNQKGKGKSSLLSTETMKSGSQAGSSDDFVIGVQDWRDPDLVAAKATASKSTTTKSFTTIPVPTSSLVNKVGKDGELVVTPGNVLTGGSITPGSGQYNDPGEKAFSENNSEESKNDNQIPPAGLRKSSTYSTKEQDADKEHDDMNKEHEGLWVTLTPTTMSTSPFFNTLLVLVVSPLVTLTVVYALLLLRSRIRRRRWRAPKSVVDRLPIRTYHTMSCSSTASSTRLATPHSSSPNTPLLQTSPRASTTRSRPRSATRSEIGDAVSASLERATALARNEKEANPKAKRKKYTGKQIECVVCLEEYVDGHSRVMSLPCGHEFHAECM